MPRKPSLAREAGRKGGETVKNRYGQGFYQSIGKKGGETVKRERGPDFYAEIGRKGGEMRGIRAAERRGTEEPVARQPRRVSAVDQLRELPNSCRYCLFEARLKCFAVFQSRFLVWV